MLVQNIYEKYHIMPSLQMHQLRVAGVANAISLDIDLQVDQEEIVSAALLHDMGNIIKFNLTLYPNFLEPQGLDYWLGIQENFKTRFGNDEHVATYNIAKEIGVSERVLDLIKAVGFTKAPFNVQHSDYSKKIVCYSDHRVSPNGVLSLKDRIEGGKKRFQKNKRVSIENKSVASEYKKSEDALFQLEKQIFEHCSISPTDLNDELIKGSISNLRNFAIK